MALAGHGHVTPTLPLVEELVRRGHHVAYATAADFAEVVTGAGAQWVQLPPMAPFRPPAQVGPDLIASWFRHYFAAMRATYPVLHEYCRTARPDAVSYDVTNWPARLVAHHLGIPAVRLIPNLAENHAYSLDDRLTEGLDPDHPQMTALAEDCVRFSTEYGVDLDVAGTMDVPEALNLVFIPREFQPAGDSFDERFHFLGPLLGRREQREPWSPPDPHAPVLYISLGTIFTDNPAFYRTCIEAFGDGSCQVAMTVGDLDPAAIGPVPPGIDVRPRFPQPAVLRHARAFISHAGMNSTMEALYYGVPLVTLPQMPEQAANADRVVELGLGERLATDTLTPDALRQAVSRVTTDEQVRANLERMRRAIHDAGGAERGAALIEDHLA
ncbi:macrolide family glycosyltransferase [Geodermatophilus siccatus]|uniref:macrolide family glycosyltransferase n=1 Tax=Geodermatophilus siccatus TaxID=1137991 RepID=UPI001C31B033|nr:macrolide family glycosyltransferase [Geodermatophilus siccatus]